MRSKELMKIFRQLAMLTQLGLSLLTPLLLCLGLCYYLVTRFSLGGWIFLPGFFFGLGGSGTVAWKFFKAQTRQSEREEKEQKPKVSYNKHSE